MLYSQSTNHLLSVDVGFCLLASLLHSATDPAGGWVGGEATWAEAQS